MKGHDTLQIDANPQCDCTNILKTEEVSKEETVWDTLVNGSGLMICATKFDHLEHVHSHPDLRTIEKGCTANFKNALEEIKGDFKFIFLDCQNDINPVTDAMLSCSDLVIIPVGTDIADIENARDTLKYIQLIQRFHNPDLKIGGVLRTMKETAGKYDTKATSLTEEALLNDEQLTDLVYKTVIPRSSKVPVAFHQRTVPLDIDPNGKVSMAYDRFVYEAFLK
jgi:chromosome partitioning protein